ncbi:hypothetical protein PHLH8_05970 [Pseudomonas sp. Pc102]|uniref:hypothetical protein n=1 Tax=Pseudomonas sp. Pc102 TaxID=2678261 RepID=UPI001BCB8280|nr:hypothetical protein [Pseudomonas sp. Pc102]BBP80955.1 hypothetical protein PHLH8_05970 [Pseudomonas sp. Pc102]
MADSRALLIFCEGPHDAAFTRLTLEKAFSYQRRTLCFSEFPYPFNALFRKSVQDHVADDLRLDMAKKFFLPDHVLGRDNNLVLIFNYGGSNRKASITPFLEKLLVLQRSGQAFSGTSKTTEIKYLFMADADSIGSQRTLEKIANEFAIISESPWITGHWIRFNETEGYSQDTDKDIYAYIWKQSAHDRGTLENIIEECVDLSPFLDAVDRHFKWNVDSEEAERASAEQSKRTKAAVSLMGQRVKPGSSMSVIVDQGGLLGTEQLESSQSVQALIRFLTPLT